MSKIVTVVGARPQLVKAAIVSKSLAAEGHEEIFVHTGQHYDDRLSAIFLRELDMEEPDYNLEIGSMRHGAQTGRMLESIEEVLEEHQPQWVLLYGDTNSTLAGALAASKMHLPIAHVEAGLRSFDRHMPEEINRVLTDHVSALLFAPTQAAVDNLEREGISGESVRLVGDVMYDAAVTFLQPREILQELELDDRPFVLSTMHRAENTDDPVRLANIFDALAALAEETDVVLPLHPRTRAALEREQRLDRVTRSLRIIEPVGYLDMLALERAATLVVTDSGGVQKEAFFARTPCVTLRDQTEWVELVDIGWNRLLSPSREDLAEALLDAFASEPPALPSEELYGGGKAARKIAETLV